MAIENRYTLVNETIEGYSDMLQYPLENFRVTRPVKPIVLSEINIERFHRFIYDYYGKSDYRDFILLYNNIGHTSFLYAGLKIMLPNILDIKNFYRDYQKV